MVSPIFLPFVAHARLDVHVDPVDDLCWRTVKFPTQLLQDGTVYLHRWLQQDTLTCTYKHVHQRELEGVISCQNFRKTAD